MFCKIADCYIEILPLYKKTEEFCKEYICPPPEKVDFSVQMCQEDIDAEMRNNNVPCIPIDGVRAKYEPLALYRKLCGRFLETDGFLMHGVVIEYEGKGYIFTAQSGTGKTTHVRLWQERFGEDKVTIINGDKPILRFLDGKVFAYGTPWNGKEHYGINGRVELKSICFVTRGQENAIYPLPIEKAITLLFSQIMIHDSADLTKQLDLADRLLQKVPVYLLRCNMETEAAEVAYRGMNG